MLTLYYFNIFGFYFRELPLHDLFPTTVRCRMFVISSRTSVVAVLLGA